MTLHYWKQEDFVYLNEVGKVFGVSGIMKDLFDSRFWLLSGDF